MMFSLINSINVLNDRLARKFLPVTSEPLQAARIKLSVILAIVFFASGIIYAATLLHGEYFTVATFVVVCSGTSILIPYTVINIKNLVISYAIYFSTGLIFASVIIFGSGNQPSIIIILWLVFIVHFGFVVLTRKAALIFGTQIAVLFVAKRALIHHGFQFPNFIHIDIISQPRLIDIIAPIFFNFFLAYISNRMRDRASRLIRLNTQDIAQLGQRIKDTESKYQLIVEKSLSYMAMVSVDGNIQFANPAMARALSYDMQDLLKLKVYDILHESVRDQFQKFMRTLLQQGSAYGIMKVKTSEGLVRYWEFSNVVTRFSGDIAIVGFALDITELENTRQALKKQEQELQVLIASLNDVIMLFDKHGLLIKYWAQTPLFPMEHLMGKSSDEVLGLIFSDNDDIRESYARARTRGLSFECNVHALLNGTSMFLNVKVSPLHSKDLSLSLHITDRTNAFLAEEGVRARENKEKKYRTIITQLSLQDFVKAVDIDVVLSEICEIAANAIEVKRAALWRFKEEESLLVCEVIWTGDTQTTSPPFLLKASRYPIFLQALVGRTTISARNARNNPITSELLADYLVPNHILSMLSVPVFLQGKLYGVVCFEQTDAEREWDTSDVLFAESLATVISIALEGDKRRRVQQELEKYTRKLEQSYADIKAMTTYLTEARVHAEDSERLKSLFLANISHEIRTPMNAIMGFSELLQRPNISEQKRGEFSRLIRERCFDLLRVINNVLDISKIEAGQLTLFSDEGNIDELMDKLISSITSENQYLQGKAIDFEKRNNLQPNEYRVCFDFMRVYQVLSNLLANAVKFTTTGTIIMGCERNDKGHLQFWVSDTGIGINPEQMKNLFKPFRQANESIHRNYGGSGLGLAICKGLVDLWGGSLWVESLEGSGSTFYFTVPFMRRQSAAVNRAAEVKFKNRMALIIENDPLCSETLSSLLNSHQVDGIIAKGGKEGIEIFDGRDDIDLVLLELALPDISGLEVARYLIQQKPDVLIIVITAHITESIRHHLSVLGVTSFITKPVNPNRFFTFMEQLLLS